MENQLRGNAFNRDFKRIVVSRPKTYDVLAWHQAVGVRNSLFKVLSRKLFWEKNMLDMLVSSAKKNTQEPWRYWWLCLESGYPLSWATWSTLYIIVVSVIFPQLPTGTHNRTTFKTSRDTSRDDYPSYVTDCGLWGKIITFNGQNSAPRLKRFKPSSLFV